MSLENAPEAPRPATAVVTQTLFLVLGGSFALWAAEAQLAMLAGAAFRTLLLGFSLTWLAAALLLVGLQLRARPGPRPPLSGRPLLALLLGVALAGAILSLGAIRPAPDDVTYAARAVYFLSHPAEPLDRLMHDHALLDFAMQYPLLLTYTAELLWAAPALLLPVSFLDVYHLAVPFLGGFLIPLAWYLAVWRLTGAPAAALVGAAAIVAFLAVDGSAHQGFGNYAFVRIWHGKALLLSLIVPLFTAAAIDWLDRPRPRAFACLYLVAVCASGLSGSALFILPLLALCIGVGHLAAAGINRRSLLAGAGLGASLAHLVALGLGLALEADRGDYGYLGSGVGFPESFAGQLALVFPGDIPLARIVLALSVVACAFLAPPKRRRFLLGWLGAAVVVALNPISMGPVVEHLTTYNAYWRVFYILPFPLALGAAAAWLARRAGPTAGHVAAATVALALTAGLANYLWPGPSSFGAHRFDLGSYKLPPRAQLESRTIVSHARPGATLAPYPMSMVLPLLSADFPQAAVDYYFLIHFARLHGQGELADSRRQATRFVSGRSAKGLEDVVRLLDAGLQNVVVTPKVARDPELRAALRARGYEKASGGQIHVLFTKALE